MTKRYKKILINTKKHQPNLNLSLKTKKALSMIIKVVFKVSIMTIGRFDEKLINWS